MQLNCRKKTSFFCRPIELKATHVIWTVDRHSYKSTQFIRTGGGFFPTGFCCKSPIWGVVT